MFHATRKPILLYRILISPQCLKDYARTISFHPALSDYFLIKHNLIIQLYSGVPLYSGKVTVWYNMGNLSVIQSLCNSTNDHSLLVVNFSGPAHLVPFPRHINGPYFIGHAPEVEDNKPSLELLDLTLHKTSLVAQAFHTHKRGEHGSPRTYEEGLRAIRHTPHRAQQASDMNMAVANAGNAKGLRLQIENAEARLLLNGVQLLNADLKLISGEDTYWIECVVSSCSARRQYAGDFVDGMAGTRIVVGPECLLNCYRKSSVAVKAIEDLPEDPILD